MSCLYRPPPLRQSHVVVTGRTIIIYLWMIPLKQWYRMVQHTPAVSGNGKATFVVTPPFRWWTSPCHVSTIAGGFLLKKCSKLRFRNKMHRGVFPCYVEINTLFFTWIVTTLINLVLTWPIFETETLTVQLPSMLGTTNNVWLVIVTSPTHPK